jgi:hypothetical protein
MGGPDEVDVCAFRQYCFQLAQSREPQGVKNSVECGEEMFALRIFRPSQGVELLRSGTEPFAAARSSSLVRISSQLNHLEYRARYTHGGGGGGGGGGCITAEVPKRNKQRIGCNREKALTWREGLQPFLLDESGGSRQRILS